MRYDNMISIDEFKDNGERTIVVLLKDKLSGELIGRKTITRAQLAKALDPLSETPVTALNGKFVIEI